MKKITLVLIMMLSFSSIHSQNSCLLPQVVTAGTYTVTAIDGEEATLICTDNGVVDQNPAAEWFSYTPTQNFTVTITTNITENTPRIDTRLHVYAGTCGALTCVTGDDDSGLDFSSEATFNVTAGTTYTFVFDNKWNNLGFSFKVIESPLVLPTGITYTGEVIGTISSQFNLCITDMNGDFRDDIVGVSATNIKVHYQNANGTFTVTDYPTTQADFMPTWSFAAADYNKDGFTDLIYGGGSGLTFMRSTNGGTAYTEVSGSEYIFCQRTNFVDFNNDGNLDAFSCHDVDPNIAFVNDGQGNLVFHQSGITNYPIPGNPNNKILVGVHPEGGNYGSIFVDYDNDGDQDLFIAKCRGGAGTAKINELHRNTSYTDSNGNKIVRFEDVSVASNMADPVQTWSAAWADFDNDGDMDALVGASSTADGLHKYMRNNGNGTFTDITAGSGWDTNASYNIEHIAHDFDNNGFVDVMGGGNKIMMNQGNGTFVSNPTSFGVGAVGDINDDGFLDIQSGSTIYKGNNNNNNWIKFGLQGIQSNRNGIGARIEIYGVWGKQIRDVRSGDGFRYMSSLNAHFGIGTATAIDQVIIRWPSGIVDTYTNVGINQKLSVVEGSTLSVENFTSNGFSVYPNPARDVLSIQPKNNIQLTSAAIYDLNGKILKDKLDANTAIDVSSLSSGTYILLVNGTDAKNYATKFIKE
jgi:hypothetical protein